MTGTVSTLLRPVVKLHGLVRRPIHSGGLFVVLILLFLALLDVLVSYVLMRVSTTGCLRWWIGLVLFAAGLAVLFLALEPPSAH